MPDIKQALEHPMIASFTMIAIIAGGLTGVGTITGWYGLAHTTQDELQALDMKHVTLINANRLALDQGILQSRCQSLRIEISLAESTIWQMEQAGDDSQRLVERRRELRDLLSKYNSLSCATILR